MSVDRRRAHPYPAHSTLEVVLLIPAAGHRPRAIREKQSHPSNLTVLSRQGTCAAYGWTPAPCWRRCPARSRTGLSYMASERGMHKSALLGLNRFRDDLRWRGDYRHGYGSAGLRFRLGVVRALEVDFHGYWGCAVRQRIALRCEHFGLSVG